MDSLPTEILGLILEWNVELCRRDKNLVLPLRRVCRAFDAILRKYVFCTVQLDFSRFLKNARPAIDSLAMIGPHCGAMFLDMRLVRDEEDITRLSNLFRGLSSKPPEMAPLLDNMRRHCLSDTTFDETDFQTMVLSVLEHLPNFTRLNMNLPFQILGENNTTATLLLATTFACIAKRGEDALPLETLALDHVSDTTVNNICNNPIDLANTLAVFRDLKNLVLLFKRQDKRHLHFKRNFWYIIRRAYMLENLCLVGCNVKRDLESRRLSNAISFADWFMRSLPCPPEDGLSFRHLKCLELKRVDVDPYELIQLIRCCSQQLKELYFIEIYLKVFSSQEHELTPLWIGLHDTPRPEHTCWVAKDLHNMKNLKLDVLRVTGLGYDDYQEDPASPHPDYDLQDPTGQNRSFDERFVQAVMQAEPDSAPTSTLSLGTTKIPGQLDCLESSHSSEPISSGCTRTHIREPLNLSDYDANAFQRNHNTTSHFKNSIDGYFTNYNEQGFKELQELITLAGRGIALMTQEIDRFRTATVDPATGHIVPGTAS